MSYAPSVTLSASDVTKTTDTAPHNPELLGVAKTQLFRDKNYAPIGPDLTREKWKSKYSTNVFSS